MRDLINTGKQLLFRSQTSVLSAATIIIFTYAISHVMGLIKTRLLIAQFFGDSAHQLDVYYAAFVVPDTLFQILVTGSLSAAFIPIFSKIFKKSPTEAWRAANISIGTIGFLLLIITITISIFSRSISSLIAPGFSDDQLNTLSHLMVIMLISQLIFAASAFTTSMLQSSKKFIVPALAPVFYNLGIILGIVFLSKPLDIYGPAFGVVLGAILHFAIQIPLITKLGFRLSPIINFKHQVSRDLFKLLPARSMALGIDQVEQLVGVFLATTLSSGSVVIFNVAKLLYTVPVSLFGSTMGQAALPLLSEQVAESELEKFKKTLKETILQTLYLSLPFSILLIVLRIPIVRLVFGAPGFTWDATITTGTLVAILAISSPAATIMQVIIRAFHALHDTKTPLVVGSTIALVGSVLSFVSVTVLNYGLLGLASTISIMIVIECLILVALISKKISPQSQYLSAFLKPVIKMTFSAITTGLVLWASMRVLDLPLDTTKTIQLVLLTIITLFGGAVCYYVMSKILKIDELASYENTAKRFINFKSLISGSKPFEPVSPDQ